MKKQEPKIKRNSNLVSSRSFLRIESSYTDRDWRLPTNRHYRLSQKISQQHSISNIVSRSIARRVNFKSEIHSYLNPNLYSCWIDPYELKDMSKAAWRLFQAIVRKERIGFYFHNTTPSIASLVLFTKFLKSHKVEFSYSPFYQSENDVFVPSEQGLQFGQDFSLIFILGGGTNLHYDFKECKHQHYIAIDNTVSTEFLPNVFALINSNRFDEHQNFSHLGFTTLTYLLLEATNQLLVKNNQQAFDFSQFMDLAALGTSTENLPATGLNRAIIREGIRQINQRTNLGLRYLADELSLNEKVNSYHIKSLLGPCLCSGAMIKQYDLGLRLLKTTSKLRAPSKAAILVDSFLASRERKNHFQEQCINNIFQRDPTNPLVWSTITKCPLHLLKEISEAISRLTNRTTLIFGIKGNRVIVHGHSTIGVNLGVIIANCFNEGLISSGGGNAQEVKFEADLGRISEIVEFVSNQVSKQSWWRSDNNCIEVDGIMNANAVSIELFEEMEILEPYGIGSPRPRWVFPYHKVANRRKNSQGTTRYTLEDDFGGRIDAYVVGHSKTRISQFLQKCRKDSIHVLGYCTSGYNSGRFTPILNIEDIAKPN